MIQFPTKKSARSAPGAVQAWIERVRAAGDALVRRGIPLGRHFSRLDESAVATQRSTKDELSSRLKAAAEAP